MPLKIPFAPFGLSFLNENGKTKKKLTHLNYSTSVRKPWLEASKLFKNDFPAESNFLSSDEVKNVTNLFFIRLQLFYAVHY